MNGQSDDLYGDYPELQTEEEKEDWSYEPSSSEFPDLPPRYREFMLLKDLPMPGAEDRAEFERRPPALGLNISIIDEIADHAKNPLLRPVQVRHLFSLLRDKLLKNLIPCSDCSTVEELCEILRNEVESGIPSPVPSWYVYSTKTMGPRRIGYYHCGARGCLKTEDFESKPFKKCSGCGIAFYCSKDCQLADWKCRHKKVCSKAREFAEKTREAGMLLQRYGVAIFPSILFSVIFFPT